jgi:acetamidase/formamidase
MAERVLDASEVHYTWSSRHPVRLRVRPEDVVELATRDGFDGQLAHLPPEALATDISALDFDRIAPLTGPIEVEGATPGDTLTVELLEMTPSGPGWAVIWPAWADFDFRRPDTVSPGGSIARFRLEDLLGSRVRIGDVEVALEPMLGMVGTAPAEGEYATLPPRRFGGNMDCRLLRPGTTTLLPVEVPGALVSFGDGHALQGDGEISTTGIECAMSIRVKLGLDRTRSVGGPELRTATHHYFLEHARELGAAVRGAIERCHAYLVEDRGLAPEDAYLLLGMSARLEISEVVDTPHFGIRLGVPLGEEHHER